MKLRRKIASTDFTENMMPQTRKAVFGDVLKLHWFDLLRLGFLLLIALLPVFVTTVTNDVYEARLIADLGENLSEDALQAANSAAIFFRSVSAFICIPLYMLFAVVLSGALRLIRQYAWEEVVFFWRDLWVGIKQNWKQTVILAFLMGLQGAVSRYLNGIGVVTQDTAMKIVGGIFGGILWLIFFPMYAYMLIEIGIYSNSFMQNLKAGFALYAKTPFKTVLVLLCLAAVFLSALLPNFLGHIIGPAVGILLLPILLLIWFLFVSEQLDKYINPVHFPELIGRGLYQETLDKTEKEDLCD